MTGNSLIFTFDFFFRGFVILGTIIMIFSNIGSIKRNRKENVRRDTVKYYKTWLQNVPLYASYFSSVLIGLSIFRFGSLLLIRENKEIELRIFDFVLMGNSETLSNQNFIIIIGVIGAISFMVFSIIQSISFIKISTNFSDYIDIKEGNRLVKDGIYGKIRHPMYLCEIMLPLSASLALQNWMVFLWSVFVILPLYLLRAKKEDELLEHYYKNDFLSYKKSVSGFVPFL